jgi:CheY-like chemotaxis protein
MQNSGMEHRQILSTDDSRVKVLVVDDHPNTAHMLARAISRLGSHVDVVSATSGLEALQHVEDGAADILITDMMMPEMTGMELIETLNNSLTLTPSVTFLLTAHDSAGVREIARRLNVKQVISKPAHPEQICELISQTVEELKKSQVVEPEATPREPAGVNPKTEPKYESLNISELIWEVAKKFQPQADIKNHLLVVGKTEPVSVVQGNAMHLRQALRSLVWSAINNTPRGGTVILSSENEADTVKIFVRDTGYGYNEMSENDGGDEDLAIVKSIAEEHGGDVTVESEVGKGTCFTLCLPI